MTSVIGLAACVQAAGPPAPAPTPGQPATVVGGWISGAFRNDAGERQYQLYVPPRHEPSRRHMLVVLLHGCTQDPMDLARGTRIAEHADREGVFVLLPEQPAGANPMKCWSWFDPQHQSRDVGEPSIIAGMTREIVERYPVDPARVHIGGISAGGAMASLVAIAYADVYASVAVHSAPAWRAATDLAGAVRVMAHGSPDADSLGAVAAEAMGGRMRPIPAFVLHGGSDAVVKPANGTDAARQWLATNRRASGSAGLTIDDSSGETGGYHWTRVCHRDGSAGCLVEAWTVAELAHAWSGGSSAGTFTDERGPDATAEMLRFFREHPRPAR